MKLHYKSHLIEQKAADQFRAYFHSFRDIGTFHTAQEAVDALEQRQRELEGPRAWDLRRNS